MINNELSWARLLARRVIPRGILGRFITIPHGFAAYPSHLAISAVTVIPPSCQRMAGFDCNKHTVQSSLDRGEQLGKHFLIDL